MNSSPNPDPAHQLALWNQNIAAAALAAHRPPSSVRLVPASKSVPAARLRAFYDAGQHLFGENRIQEAREKIPQLPSACRWHFIGGLQRNKVRDAVAWFDLIHSVDSLELLQEIERRAAAIGKTQDILIEVNVAGESSKHGCPTPQARQLIETANPLPHLRVLGLMTVPPFTPDPADARPCFARLRMLRDEIQDALGLPLPELSMGMTHDYAVAIAEGATMVRIGSGLFGSRTPA